MPLPLLGYSMGMAGTREKLTAAVESYLGELRRVRASGGATGERSYYPALANLLNAVGATLRPKVFCVGELAEQGAGHPDFGLYAARQTQRGRLREGQTPERGVVEVKPVDDDAWLTAAGDQVSRYRGRYGLVLVTNTRDFVLLGEDASGRPAKLETFRLADTSGEFEELLETPRAFARDVGAGLGEYLCRALSHRASLTEPSDLAWLLASYARDGLARVEAAGDAPSLAAVRSALEEALGVRFEGERGAAFFRSTWCRRSSTASSPRGSYGRGRLRLPPAGSTGTRPSGISARRCCGRCSSSSPTPAGCSRWAWSRCWTGRRPRSTALSGGPSSTGSARARPSRTSTSRSWRRSTRHCASSSASGTRRSRWCATWSARVDRALKDDLGIADGLAAENVYVLDPCCGTGAYLSEVLRRIAVNLEGRGLGALTGARVKQAATKRVFGFEIMPAPFVVAHLQVGLTMQDLDAPLSEDAEERAGVFLTNALTGWEPTVQKPLPVPRAGGGARPRRAREAGHPGAGGAGQSALQRIRGHGGGRGAGAVGGLPDDAAGAPSRGAGPERPVRALLPHGRAPHRREDGPGSRLLHLQLLVARRAVVHRHEGALPGRVRRHSHRQPAMATSIISGNTTPDGRTSETSHLLVAGGPSHQESQVGTAITTAGAQVWRRCIGGQAGSTTGTFPRGKS